MIDFISNRSEIYDKRDNFELQYNYKELTFFSRKPYKISIELLIYIDYQSWKNFSVNMSLCGSDSILFAKENNLRRLHKSTTLLVEMDDFQIEPTRLIEFLNGVNTRYETSIQRSANKAYPSEPVPGEDLSKNKGGRPARPWWDEFWAELAGRLYDERLF